MPFKHISSSSLEEDFFSFLPEVDVSVHILRSSIEEISSSSFSFFEQEDPSFDLKTPEDRSTIEYIFHRIVHELYDRSKMMIMII